MIVGGYDLHLYCELVAVRRGEAEDALGHSYDEFPHMFNGPNARNCYTQARRRGWLLQLGNGRAICPRCKQAGRR